MTINKTTLWLNIPVHFIIEGILLTYHLYVVVEVNDLHKFVGVALHTSAGEDDFSHDKLSQLKIVGSGYGPLIYQLKEMFDFKSFVENCQKVWLSLKQTPKLPSLLVSFKLWRRVYYYTVKSYGHLSQQNSL